ncbi:MAG: 16S rRNA (uracil(1498)-N(3))-methyltransferase [Granulosicoccus sp.]
MSKRAARTPRFFTPEAIQCNTKMLLEKKIAHHLVTVLRAKQGDSLLLFNGDGHDYRATLAETGQRGSGKSAVLHIHDRSPVHSESTQRICLAQCISRTDRMEISLRQAVELGVSHIQPLNSRHTGKTPDPERDKKRHAHWQSIIISACEQSGRATVPAIDRARDFSDWIEDEEQPRKDTYSDQVLSGTPSFVLSPTADQSLSELLHAYKQRSGNGYRAVRLVVGPESGLAAAEIQMAVDCGWLEANLGPRILRTETAGVTAVTLIQSVLGDLRPS